MPLLALGDNSVAYTIKSNQGLCKITNDLLMSAFNVCENYDPEQLSSLEEIIIKMIADCFNQAMIGAASPNRSQALRVIEIKEFIEKDRRSEPQCTTDRH